MVDQITEQLYHGLIRSYPPTASYSLPDLATQNLRSDLFRFLSFAIEEKANEEVERLSMPTSSWFDYSDDAVRERWSDYVVTLKKHPVFPSDEWAEELHRATESLVLFSIKPIAGVEQLLFRQNDAVRPSTVKGRLARLTGHDFILDAIHTLASESTKTEIDRAGFRDEVQSRLSTKTQGFEPDDWEQAIDPVFALVGDAIGKESIPVEIITMFFDDLGIRQTADRIHDHVRRYNLSNIDRSQFSDALSIRPRELQHQNGDTVGHVPGSGEESVGPDRTHEAFDSPPDQADKVVESVSTEQSTVDKDHEDDSDKPSPLWMKFQSKLNAPLSDRRAAEGGRAIPPVPEEAVDRLQDIQEPFESSKLARPEPEEDPESPNIPIWERFRNRTAPGKSAEDFSAAELRVLGETVRHKRQRYIDGLFGHSFEHYEDVIRHLDAADSWDEASIYIAEEVFRKHRINIYSELAVSFTNAVEQRYRAIQAD